MIAFICDGCQGKQEIAGTDLLLPKGWVEAKVTKSLGYMRSNPSKTYYFCPTCADKAMPASRELGR